MKMHCNISHEWVWVNFLQITTTDIPWPTHKGDIGCNLHVGFKTDLCFTIIITELRAVSCHIEPCHDATQLYVTITCDSGMTQCNLWLEWCMLTGVSFVHQTHQNQYRWVICGCGLMKLYSDRSEISIKIRWVHDTGWVLSHLLLWY